MKNILLALNLLCIFSACSKSGDSSGGDAASSLTELTCANVADFNSDMSLLTLTLSDCFFADQSAGFNIGGSISSTTNKCVYSNKEVTLTSPTYSSWLSSVKTISIKKSGSSCVDIYYNPQTELIVSKNGKYLYKTNRNSTGGTIIFQNRTWNVNTASLSSCMNQFNFFSESDGTAGAPPATGSSISFGINHLKPDHSLATSTTSQPNFKCSF